MPKTSGTSTPSSPNKPTPSGSRQTLPVHPGSVSFYLPPNRPTHFAHIPTQLRPSSTLNAAHLSRQLRPHPKPSPTPPAPTQSIEQRNATALNVGLLAPRPRQHRMLHPKRCPSGHKTCAPSQRIPPCAGACAAPAPPRKRRAFIPKLRPFGRKSSLKRVCVVRALICGAARPTPPAT